MARESLSCFVAGIIGPPFGLEGFVKLRPFSGEIEHLLALQSATVRQGGKERTLRVEKSVPAPPALLLKFAGIDSPETAKTLGGAELLVDRARACPLQEGEFYVEDLRGLAVEIADSGPGVSAPEGVSSAEILGHITDIVEGGGGDLAEIRLLNGELKLVPFRKEFFADICPEKGRMLLLNRWIIE